MLISSIKESRFIHTMYVPRRYQHRFETTSFSPISPTSHASLLRGSRRHANNRIPVVDPGSGPAWQTRHQSGKLGSIYMCRQSPKALGDDVVAGRRASNLDMLVAMIIWSPNDHRPSNFARLRAGVLFFPSALQLVASGKATGLSCA